MPRLPPIVRALAAQGAAFALLLLLPLAFGGGWDPWLLVGIDAVLAVAWSWTFRLPWWWLPVQALLPFLVVAAAGWAVPNWAWAAGAVLLGLVFGGGIRSRVPLYLSSRSAHRELLALLPAQPGIRVIDLGCGFGGPVLALARARPDARIEGVEASPFTWLVARLRALRSRARIRFGSLWHADLRDATVVYAFLSSEPMPVLWEKCCEEMTSGSLLVSNTFAVPDVTAERTIPLPGRSDAALFVYRIP